MKNVELKIIAALLLLAPNLTHSAELYFGTQGQEVVVGQTLEVGVFLNTDGQSVNAMEGRVMFPADLFEASEVREGGSIISMWVEKPHTTDRGVVFSGIVPGGYMGERGYLFSLALRAVKAGEAIITTEDNQVLLHDGTGTPAALRNSPLTLRINKTGLVPEFAPPSDAEPPEAFVPEISRDPSIFEGKWFVSFVTQDKGSGIDRYVINESRRMRKQITPNKWIAAESPYVLQDQKLRSYVSVKAVDNAGNERIAAVAPRYLPRWYERWRVWSIMGAGAIALYALGRILWRKKIYR